LKGRILINKGKETHISCCIVLLCNGGRQQTIATSVLDIAHSSELAKLFAYLLLVFCQTRKSSGDLFEEHWRQLMLMSHVNITPPAQSSPFPLRWTSHRPVRRVTAHRSSITLL